MESHQVVLAASPVKPPSPGVPSPGRPKGPIGNGHKPGQKPNPEKGKKPPKPGTKGNGKKKKS
jgi:hypothetical protein